MHFNVIFYFDELNKCIFLNCKLVSFILKTLWPWNFTIPWERNVLLVLTRVSNYIMMPKCPSLYNRTSKNYKLLNLQFSNKFLCIIFTRTNSTHFKVVRYGYLSSVLLTCF
jgi:hypothetical protein